MILDTRAKQVQKGQRETKEIPLVVKVIDDNN